MVVIYAVMPESRVSRVLGAPLHDVDAYWRNQAKQEPTNLQLLLDNPSKQRSTFNPIHVSYHLNAIIE